MPKISGLWADEGWEHKLVAAGRPSGRPVGSPVAGSEAT